jgi:hypothetical protein
MGFFVPIKRHSAGYLWHDRAINQQHIDSYRKG